MALTIDFGPETEGRLRDIACGRGVEVAEVVREMVERSLRNGAGGDSPTAPARLTDEELDAKLRAAGVRMGDTEGSRELLRSWRGQDLDPDGTVEEWDQIMRNIEEGGLQLRRVNVDDH